MLVVLHEDSDGLYFYADKKYYWQPRVGVVHEMSMLQCGQAIRKKLTSMEEISEMLYRFAITREGCRNEQEGTVVWQDSETYGALQEAGVCEQNAGD